MGKREAGRVSDRLAPRSWLLAPTLGKERTKARKTLDIDCPALGASPRKEGDMYHIFTPQGQTQFARRKRAEQLGRMGLVARQRHELAPPVGRAVGGFDQPRRSGGGDRGPGLVESQRERTRAARQAEAVEQPADQQTLHQVGEVGRGGQGRPGGAGKAALGRGGRHGLARGGHPKAAPGQLAGQVRRNHAAGAGDEADQPRLVHDLARDEVAPLALAHRLARAQISSSAAAMAASPSSYSASISSSTTSGSGSIQPIATRARMISPSAASAESPKASRTPGSRTRSPSFDSNQPRRSSGTRPARSSTVFTSPSPSATLIGRLTPSMSRRASSTPSSRRFASYSAASFSRKSRARACSSSAVSSPKPSMAAISSGST